MCELSNFDHVLGVVSVMRIEPIILTLIVYPGHFNIKIVQSFYIKDH